MVLNYSSGKASFPQIPGCYPDLQRVCAVIDATALMTRLQAYRPTGRPGYPLLSLWRAYIARYVLNLRDTNDLIRRLQDDPGLRAVCGFGDTLPHRTTFNRFIRRLADHTDLVAACFAGVTDRIKELLPDLGREVAIDATAVPAYSNPRRPSDPDAAWGMAHSAQSANKEGKEFFFGFKSQTMADAKYALPLFPTVTPGNRNDSPELRPLLEKAKDRYPWLQPRAAIADRGYDSAANHRFLYDQHGIDPVIHIRKPSNARLYHGLYTHNGIPTCLGQVPMEYVETNTAGHHLYRCPPAVCPLKGSFRGGIRHCDTEYWQDPQEDIRLFGAAIRRDSPEWRALYAKRWSVERLFSALKDSRSLETHHVRGLRRITLHIWMALLTYQAQVLVNLQAGDKKGMRRMKRRIP